MARRQKNNQEIGRRIKFYRLKSGLTQQQMAAKLEVAQGQISDYEAGKVAIPIDLLGYMADLLNVSIAVLDDSLTQIPFFRNGLASCESKRDIEKNINNNVESFRRRALDAVMDSELDPVAKSKVYQIIKNLPSKE